MLSAKERLAAVLFFTATGALAGLGIAVAASADDLKVVFLALAGTAVVGHAWVGWVCEHAGNALAQLRAGQPVLQFDGTVYDPARRDTEDDTSPLEPDHEGPQSDEDDGPQVAVGHTNGTRTR